MTSSDPPAPSRPRSATIIMPPEPPPPPAAARTATAATVKLPDNKPAPAPVAPNLPATPEPGGATVKLVIDGESLEVRKGTNVLEAAKLLGKDICHFCYHPGLSIAASCRQCLVEIEKNPKLQPSCQQVVAEGMVVHTESPAVLESRRALLEFTLKNHHRLPHLRQGRRVHAAAALHEPLTTSSRAWTCPRSASPSTRTSAARSCSTRSAASCARAASASARRFPAPVSWA
ncbi:MAG: 2Fe-2S iron-sulfur cluster-binding protein [Nannocystaceae bacterium]